MADTTTPVYSFVLPEIDGSDGTWGTKLNANLTALDGLLSGSANLQNASFTGTASFGGSTGTAGQVLKSQGAGANAIWTDDSNTTYTAGSGLSLTGTEFANTAPDQTVVMNAGSGISVSGTYPTFTVTNSSPDQTVGLTGTGGTTISGTYPNFTINSTDNNTTYTAGTGLTLTSTEFSVTDNGIGALQLNVSGNGTNGQVLASDGDGSFSWASTGTGGNETLAQTLALGAVTGGTDISVSSGDNIVMAANSTVDGRDVSVDGTKLDGIETGATADQTAAEILTAIKTVDGTGSGLDADTIDGLEPSALSVSESGRVTGSSFATTGSPSNVLEYQQADSQSDTKLAPNTDWHNTIRMGHGNPYSYYSNTLAMRMTGSGAGSIFTQLISNNTAQGWRQVWDSGNDGSGSGLDADTVDGIQASSFLRSDANDNCSGQINFTAGMKLDNHVIFNGNDTWFRSSGATGWFNATYSGGMYMLDTTWVRVYNGKRLYVPNQIAATGNITAYYSDERLKTKTGGIENALEKVQSLSGFTYVENDLARELGYANEKQQVGVSAQQVQAVIPEAVSLAPVDFETDEHSGEITSKSGENYLTVDYSRIVPLLIEAIKELKAEIEELKGGV